MALIFSYKILDHNLNVCSHYSYLCMNNTIELL